MPSSEVVDSMHMHPLAELQPQRIAQIGKSVGGAADGIEAGLYLCSLAVFDALATLSETRSYFTLAQARMFRNS